MANISIRKLDDHVYHQLQNRAVSHGVSMEEEVRRIITYAVSTSGHVTDIFRKYFGKEHGIDLGSPSARDPHEPVDFEE